MTRITRIRNEFQYLLPHPRPPRLKPLLHASGNMPSAAASEAIRWQLFLLPAAILDDLHRFERHEAAAEHGVERG